MSWTECTNPPDTARMIVLRFGQYLGTPTFPGIYHAPTNAYYLDSVGLSRGTPVDPTHWRERTTEDEPR